MAMAKARTKAKAKSKTRSKTKSKPKAQSKARASAVRSASAKAASVPGWTSKMEDRYRKRLQEYVTSMTSGPYGRVIRAAIVNAEFRKQLEKNPAGVLKDNGIVPKGGSIVLVAEDRGVFPVIIPKVLIPSPEPRPSPEPWPGPEPGPRPKPTPGPDPLPGGGGRPGGIIINPGDLTSGTRAFMNDDFDTSVANDSGKHRDDTDANDVTKQADGWDPAGDPDSRD
jgi:hypothetical protein